MQERLSNSSYCSVVPHNSKAMEVPGFPNEKVTSQMFNVYMQSYILTYVVSSLLECIGHRGVPGTEG